MEWKVKEEREQVIIATIILLLIAIGAYQFYEKYKVDGIKVSEVKHKNKFVNKAEENKKGKFEIMPIKLININEESQDELKKLPGIGEVLAERIIAYRNDKGRFERKEDITKVKGIGQKKFEKLKNFITVR